MKKTLFLCGLLFVLAGCGQKAQEEVSNQQQKETKESVKEEVKKEETVKDEMVNEDMEITETENSSNISADWKTYKNEKYGYSFKYPKDWHVYENIDYSSCGPEYNSRKMDDSELILSKDKKEICEIIGSSIGYNFGGDILISVNEARVNINQEKNSYKNSKDYNISGFYGFVVPVLENTEMPRWNVTRFYTQANNFDYYIAVKQLDDKGNIDADLMKVVNSIFIEK